MDLVTDGGHVLVESNGYTCNKQNLLEVLQTALFFDFHSEVPAFRNDAVTNCINKHTKLELSLYRCSLLALSLFLNSTSDNTTALDIANLTLHPPNWRTTIHQVRDSTSILVSIYVNTTLESLFDQLITIDSNPYFEIVDFRLAAVFFTLTGILLLLMLFLHLLLIIFRNDKSVKASSPCLLNISYIGAYIIAIMTTVYFVQKAVFISSDAIYIHLCQTFLLACGMGFSLLSGMILMRTWRLYQIFVHYKNPGSFLSDSKLSVAIFCMALVNFIICLVWFLLDPIRRDYIRINRDPHNGRITSRAVCESKVYPIWLMLLFGYQLVPMLATVWFAFLLREKIPKSQRQFRSLSMIKAIYVVLILFGLGIPLYFLAHYFLHDLVFEFTTVGVLLNGILLTCIFMLFLPPLFPVIKMYLTVCRNKCHF